MKLDDPHSPLAHVSLDERYTRTCGQVFLNGNQALARLPLLQHLRDRGAGLHTAGFISGYRGSPLGGLDQTLWRARAHLQAHDVVFQPGVNEDLAAASVWGSQQLGLFPGARYDGVFALWYGKGPGVDRSADVLRHGNAAGSARHGGVLLVAGDDHGARSSTLPHQTDHLFKALMIPVLAPADVQDYLDLGLHGWALSRYSGCWVALKAVSETVEASATVDADPFRVQTLQPEDFELPPGGLNIRWPDPPLIQERRLLEHKLYAALAYCRRNRLNRIELDSPQPRLGIISAGKAYLDLRQALDDLGIDAALAAAIGLRVYRIGMVWPLEAQGVRRFAQGLEEILVVEEKRQLLEYQLKEELYNWREDVRPRVIGKFDEKGEWALLEGADGRVHHGQFLLPASGELSPMQIARVVAARIGRYFTSPLIRDRLAVLEAKETLLTHPPVSTERMPYFCPGCPHNTSTRVPEGSHALAGIGCHYMATWMDRATATFSHMGGEGVAWIGQAPFTDTRHVFANLGDGTYYHSGLLAIRAAVAAQVSITYKILYNDAVAMTGGQPVDGPLSVPIIARQLTAEGVHQIIVVTDGTPRGYGPGDLPHGVTIRPRAELDAVQRELRAYPGVSALIYDQTCAAEKRRRLKQGRYPQPTRRLFINSLVCEGCGDCSRTSNCLAVVPSETEFGRKRAIDQSACNTDYSCADGFCPSFVSVEHARPRRGRHLDFDPAPPPAPVLPRLESPYSLLVTGIGGTGVITLGALIGMAAHLDGHVATVSDMTGLAQKGGAVFSHVRLAAAGIRLHALRIAAGEADALLGGDLLVSAGAESLTRLAAGRSRAVVNTALPPTGDFTHDPDWHPAAPTMQTAIEHACGHRSDAPRCDFFDAQTLALALLGDAVYANLLLLGYGWQRGLVPVSEAALLRAIELNGVAVATNQRAFVLGRVLAHDRAAVFARLPPPPTAPTLAERIALRARFLADYQDAAYAERYLALVRTVAAQQPALHEAVALNYFRLLAYKDEYEVARLSIHPDFTAALAANFEDGGRLRFHFAAPWAREPNPATGVVRKLALGAWVLPLLRLLARGKRLRGSRFDLFGYSAERRRERALIGEYEADVARLLAEAEPSRAALAMRIACLPAQIRGFGWVKQRHIEAYARERIVLWRQWQAGPQADCSVLGQADAAA